MGTAGTSVLLRGSTPVLRLSVSSCLVQVSLSLLPLYLKTTAAVGSSRGQQPWHTLGTWAFIGTEPGKGRLGGAF